ncbi:uncharacterized protein LOC143038518 [Oratosquilla oratoria]|uniref:uncharacterized protein LOC143038518 n=1 Tax=Oratosquilla oratoria TaxID=337810 RepID=UPI003F75DFFC
MSGVFSQRAPFLLWAVGLLCTIGLSWAVSSTASTKESELMCYQFTWPGVKKNVNCEDIHPCFKPFVYSEPSSRPPNLTVLNDVCTSQPCPKIKIPCTSSCIRWNWYDVSGDLFNYTLFCGTMSDLTLEATTGPEEVKDGCFQYRDGTFSKEVCVCKTDLCNGSTKGPLIPLPVLFLSLGLYLLLGM